jgi:hypothetical protein
MTNDRKLRGFVAVAYQHLCHFRDDISVPINPTLSSHGSPSEVERALTPYLAISAEVTAEGAALMAEFADFERQALVS